MYNKGGYPQNQIIEVEALRYLYLAKRKQHHPKEHGETLRVLILGDYSSEATKAQMTILHEAVNLLSQSTTFVCKPHPANPISPEDYPGLQMTFSSESLQNLLEKCDIAYTSNITSAAVDAWCYGVRVISFIDGSTLNMSPLLGFHGVEFVSDAKELATCFTDRKNIAFYKSNNYFNTDISLSKWKTLMNL
jgi:surface carbohydrate biosynthesis protein (TIGR04326 family)